MTRLNPLLENFIKNSTIEGTDVINQSSMFKDIDYISTPIPMVNAALSGDINGGMGPGILQIAGNSKNFKTFFALLMVSSFLTKYDDGVVFFYDSEKGASLDFFESFGIDTDKIGHSYPEDIEELKLDMAQQLNRIVKGQHVLILVDSIGNIASKKEMDDAEEGKSVTDMSRAKALKSLFRVVAPKIIKKNLPAIFINHTYKEISLYPKDIVSGGTGSYYNSNDIWIMGRQQDKEQGKELEGFYSIINIEKSRTVKEKSKFSINIDFDKGIQKWSGLFDEAVERGLITSPSKGYYQVTGSDKKYRKADLEYDNDFWVNTLKNTDLAEYIRKKYQFDGKIIQDE